MNLVFGNGYLGRRLATAYDYALVVNNPLLPDDLDKILDVHQPEVVINAVGKTGRPNIDWCETHQAETFHANVTLARLLASKCQQHGVRFVHLSSGCIYTGGPFTEQDPPNFFGSYYSRTKIQAEEAVLEQAPEALVIRLRMPFDGLPDPRNLITKLVGYTSVVNTLNSMTYVPDLIMVLRRLIKIQGTGIWHVVNPGSASPAGLMRAYSNYVDRHHKFTEVTDLAEIAGRRSNCFLHTTKLASLGLGIQAVDYAIYEAMHNYRRNKGFDR